jgi:hypothetical protein
LVHRLHSKLGLSHLHLGIDLLNLVFPDQVSNGRVRNHDLHRKNPSFSSCPGDELLGQDPLQDKGELSPDLLLLVGREDIDDSVDRFHAGVGMEGGEGQMARLRREEGGLNCLQVSHFTDQDDVRVLTENVSKGGAKTFCIGIHLSLIDDALLMSVKIFDRILNGNDVRASFVIDLVNHCGQRRRLSCSCRTRYQDQPFWFLNQFPGNGGDPQFREAHDIERDGTKGPGHCTPLHVNIAPESAQSFNAKRKIELIIFLELVTLGVGQDAVTESLCVGGREHRRVKISQFSIDPKLRGRSGGDVQIGCLLLNDGLQQFL